MTRLGGLFRLAAPLALMSASLVRADSSPLPMNESYSSSADAWIEIALDPRSDITVAWADGDSTKDEVGFRSFEGAGFVLTNRSSTERSLPDVTVSSSAASLLKMLTLSATRAGRTHMVSVMNPTGTDVLSFDPGFVLDGGESVSIAVEATPAD